jgi:TonB family protein
MGMLLLMAALLGPTDAIPPPGRAMVVHHKKVVIIDPVWLEQPSREDIDQAYPPFAKQNGVNGRAVLECTAQPDGTLDDCEVVMESPEGEGFGLATLKLTPHYRMAPKDAKGHPVAGFRARLTVAWGVMR